MAKECEMCGRKEDHYGKGTLPIKDIKGVGGVCKDCSEGSSDDDIRDVAGYAGAMTSALTTRNPAKSSGVCRNCSTLRSPSGECSC